MCLTKTLKSAVKMNAQDSRFSAQDSKFDLYSKVVGQSGKEGAENITGNITIKSLPAY